MNQTAGRQSAPSRCAQCARLRLMLAGALLALVLCLGLRAASSSAASPPDTPATAVPAASSAPQPTVVSPAPPPPPPAVQGTPPADLRLVYQTVTLPSGRRGLPYGPHQLAKGGTPPYRFTVDGALPPGLRLGDDGRLGGQPTTTGSFRFVLSVQDAVHAAIVEQQAYVLYVGLPPVPRPPASAASVPRAPAAPPALTALTPAEADATANQHVGLPASYKLTPADLARLVPEATPATGPGTQPEQPEGAPVPLAATAEPLLQAPTEEQLKALLQPLIDVEYPTRALFVNALEQARCVYYRAHVREMALKRGMTVDERCPPEPPAAARRPVPAKGGVPLRSFFDGLLPAATRDEVVALAEKRHPFGDAKPLRLTGDGCGCSTPRNENEVLGFLPYWLAGEAPLSVDFSVYTRLSYMGAVLSNSGNWARPPGWDGQASGFAREAQRHGTRLDLVLYRRDWSSLLNRPAAQLDEVAQVAARNAVITADTRHEDLAARMNGFLLPSWRESPHVYDGVTVFFEDSPTEGPQQQAFARFLKLFLQRLVVEMQATGRAYYINVVVPGQQLGDTGAYNFQDLMDFMEAAEPPRSSKSVEESDKKAYRGKTDLTVTFLVLLDGPTEDTTTALRARIDTAAALVAHRRIAFLESVMPVLFHERGDKPVPLPPVASDRLDRDLAYINWTYGGVGLWPATTAGVGEADAVRALVQRNYGPTRGTLTWVCDLTCPNRVPLRLLLEALLLAETVGIALYAWNCRVRRIGRRYQLALWAGGFLLLVVAPLLLNCDPALAQLRNGNFLLYALILVLFWGSVFATFKPRVGVP